MAPRLIPLAVVLALLSLAAADILWDTCDGPADHPSVKEGNYYNLCIREHEFSDLNYAWTFTKTTISDTVFDNCVFQNTEEKTSNFTETSWTDVQFRDCRFGSFTDQPMIFDQFEMTNVVFKDCVFHNTVNMNFSRFQFNNVTFEGCRFQSDVVFELGEVNSLTFSDCRFQRSDSHKTKSGNDALLFRSLILRDMLLIDSNVVNPVRFEGVSAADLSFNDSNINEFWCHSVPERKGNTLEIKYRSEYNDTAFQAVTLADNLKCDETTWRGFFMGNVTFRRNADFSDSQFLDLYWDEVTMKSDTHEKLILDFSNSYIHRKVLANTSIDGEADFTDAVLETVFIKNFDAKQPRFTDTEFREQEFVDGYCCSSVCRSLSCMCNVSEPSGECPVGDRKVNVSAPLICFPADATVSRYDGLVVRMEDLEYADKVAVGGGEHSDVFFFGHRNQDHVAEFVSIHHAGSKTPLRLSPGHYIYVDGKLRTARSVRPGDSLRGANGEYDLVVLSVEREMLRGLYAPTSLHGDILVDGVVVSSYTDVMHPDLSHKLLYPLRLLYRYGLHSVVSRFTALHQRSFAHVPRALGIPHGPQALDN